MQEFEGQADDVFTRLIADTVGKVSTGPIKASVGYSEPSERDTGNSDETVDAQSEEVTLTADYSPERSLAITTTKSLVAGFEEYLNNAKLSGAVSTAQLRSLKKLFDQRKLKNLLKTFLLLYAVQISTEIFLPHQCKFHIYHAL